MTCALLVWALPIEVWRAGDRAPAAPAASRSAGRQAWTWAVGAVLPALCFALNELPREPLFQPTWARPGWWTWWSLALSPTAQRPLYPLLVWATAALVASEVCGRRAAWIGAGLAAGVAVTAVFSVLYYPVLPLMAVLAVVGVGLLGLGPHLALATYLVALIRYRRAGAERSPALAGGIAGLLSLGLWRGAAAVVELHAALPGRRRLTATWRRSRPAGARPGRGPSQSGFRTARSCRSPASCGCSRPVS